MNEIIQRFTPLGLGVTRILKPEAAVEYHQRTVDIELAPNVPESTRKSFERIQRTHAMGILDYELFTVAEGYAWLVLEQAFAERFVAYYDGQIPLISRENKTDTLRGVRIFDQVFDALNKGGSHSKGGWRVVSKTKPGVALDFSGTFRNLIDWARHEGLLHGQRFRRMEDVLVKIRNAAAHPTSYSRHSPLDSAENIRQVAEIINRVWGMMTPGGRSFPAPIQREILLPCWNPEDGTLSSMRADQLENWGPDRKDWQFIAVLGVDHDENLWYFDSDFQSTNFPAEYLWGPGGWQEAKDWLATAQVTIDKVDYLDRWFVVRILGVEQVDPPRNLNQFAGLPDEARPGRWLLVNADWPNDAYLHAGRVASGMQEDQTIGFCMTCCVETVADGTWQEVIEAAGQLRLEIRAQPQRGVRVEHNRFRWL